MARRPSAKERALKLLSARWRTGEELRRRLLALGYGPEEVSRALEELRGLGLVDDERFARELARDRGGRRLVGDQAILAALRERGVAREVAEAALEEAGEEGARARELARRRARSLAGLPPQDAFRKLYGLLVRRGFPPAAAARACREALGAEGPEELEPPPEG
ncbi:MAG TPA: RecX family transcriptional regulator [Actinomycetota bacterium]|nr:RecX family transcriptional regulator [Actinomycetota bacterium]